MVACCRRADNVRKIKAAPGAFRSQCRMRSLDGRFWDKAIKMIIDNKHIRLKRRGFLKHGKSVLKVASLSSAKTHAVKPFNFERIYGA